MSQFEFSYRFSAFLVLKIAAPSSFSGKDHGKARSGSVQSSGGTSPMTENISLGEILIWKDQPFRISEC